VQGAEPMGGVPNLLYGRVGIEQEAQMFRLLARQLAKLLRAETAENGCRVRIRPKLPIE
jgi:hypothetical protein